MLARARPGRSAPQDRDRGYGTQSFFRSTLTTVRRNMIPKGAHPVDQNTWGREDGARDISFRTPQIMRAVPMRKEPRPLAKRRVHATPPTATTYDTKRVAPLLRKSLLSRLSVYHNSLRTVVVTYRKPNNRVLFRRPSQPKASPRIQFTPRHASTHSWVITCVVFDDVATDTMHDRVASS